MGMVTSAGSARAAGAMGTGRERVRVCVVTGAGSARARGTADTKTHGEGNDAGRGCYGDGQLAGAGKVTGTRGAQWGGCARGKGFAGGWVVSSNGRRVLRGQKRTGVGAVAGAGTVCGYARVRVRVNCGYKNGECG